MIGASLVLDILMPGAKADIYSFHCAIAAWPNGESVGLVTRGCGFESRLRQELLVGGVNNERSLHLQYHDCSETFEQGTEPPTAPRAPQHFMPTAPGVCVHLDGLNAENTLYFWLYSV